MDHTTPPVQQPASLSALTTWERWVDSFFVWMPYVTLAASVVLAQLGSIDLSERLIAVALTLVAAMWTWLTFTRWSMEAMGSSVGMGHEDMPELFLQFGDKSYLLQRWIILAFYAVFFAIAAIWMLRRQDVSRK